MAERPTLFVIPASNAALAAVLVLDRKGIEYRRVDLPTAVHRPILRALRFPGPTVPALRIGGERVQGSRAIAAHLERVRPEPPLFPADPARRARVEEIERWSEAELQPVLRRLQPYAVLRDRASIRSLLEGSRLGVPTALAARTAAPAVWAMAKIHGSNEDEVRATLAALPGIVERIDAWIADGSLDPSAPTAADLHVASTIHSLMRFDDLRDWLESRPAGRHAQALVPPDSGRIRRVLPADAVAAATGG